MKSIPFFLCLILLTSSPPVAAEEGSLTFLSEVRYHLGDDPRWASADFDDTNWESAIFWELPGAASLMWIRGELEVTATQHADGEPLGLIGGMLATCEIYWDGELLPRQGQVGATAEAEVPGPLQFLIHIPDRLAAPGRHQLALLCSTHHRHFEPATGFWFVGAGPYGGLAVIARRASWKAMVSLSGMLIFAIFSLVLFALEPADRSHLLLGLFCLAGAGLLVAEAWRALYPYTYNWHLLRLSVVTALAWILGMLLIAFLLTRFRLPHRARVLALTGLLATLPVLLFKWWDGKVFAILVVIGVSGLLLTAQAMRRREPGSGLVAAGLLLGHALAIANPERFADQSLYLALDLLLICLLISHAFQLRRTREEREEARLKSVRLEIELLKRRIQPHFLMNTLTALAEWIEEDPGVAGRMVLALAEELRLLSEISGQKLITLAEELRLCRYHLEIMSHRRDCTFRLITEGVDESAPIPPAVLHTLVENALTHNCYPEPEIAFRLRQEVGGEGIRWIFEAPLRSTIRPGEPAEGTGLRYVRARLREGFGERTRLFQGPRGDVWRTEIVVPSGPQRAAAEKGSRWQALRWNKKPTASFPYPSASR